ncbi:MAG: flagellar FliJ family protein [Bryobacterales bacterium]|nr:flagellar FliJ family protein [Bryobacteraceae bacterium]MDW8129571.1 flagellar FliJ family protein [Bryobacterales bacterium]
MKRFVFRLEPVLRWRRGQLELEQNRLRELAAERDRIRMRLRELEQHRREQESQLLSRDALSGAELAALEAWRLRQRAERERCQQALLEAERRLAEQRERVLEARRRVRLLEKLRERRYGEWQAEVERQVENLAAESHLGRLGRV